MNKYIHNLKIGMRLFWFFLIITVFTILGFVYVIYETRVVEEQLDDIYKVHLTSLDYLLQADRDAYQSSVSVIQAIVYQKENNDEEVQVLLPEIKDNLQQVNDRFSLFVEVSHVDDEGSNKVIKQTFYDAYKELDIITKLIIEKLDAHQDDEALLLYEGVYQNHFLDMRESIDKYTLITEEVSKAAYDHSVDTGSSILINSILITMLIIIVLVFGAVGLTRSITTPMFKVVQLLKQLSQGHFEASISMYDANRKDEIGSLMVSMQSMIENVRNIVETIIINSEHISGASNQLKSTSEQLAEAASEQASSVEEVSSTMEEIASNITQNSDNANKTKKISNSSSEGIKRLVKASKKSLESIKTISKKITVINDISFQTNILALNAAVEAARSGEHGKGFAVVASEVRSLAERSKIAADEIIELSQNSLELTQISNSQMEELLPSIVETSQLVEEISTSSIEQKNGTDQVNDAMQQLNIITQQNASTSEELAASSEELAGQASILKEVITFFKITDEEKSKLNNAEVIIENVNKKETVRNSERSNKNRGVNLNIDVDPDLDKDGFEKF